MSITTLKDLSERMRKIDFAMLTTRTDTGALASRPMSNNGEVEYDGDSFFFTYDGARLVADIAVDSKVALTFTGSSGLVGGPPVFIAVEGHASLIRDPAQFAEHWSKGLQRWFPQGTETPGLTMVQVHADRINYWDGSDQGEVTP